MSIQRRRGRPRSAYREAVLAGGRGARGRLRVVWYGGLVVAPVVRACPHHELLLERTGHPAARPTTPNQHRPESASARCRSGHTRCGSESSLRHVHCRRLFLLVLLHRGEAAGLQRAAERLVDRECGAVRAAEERLRALGDKYDLASAARARQPPSSRRRIRHGLRGRETHLHVVKVLVLDAVDVDRHAVRLSVVELEDVDPCRDASRRQPGASPPKRPTCHCGRRGLPHLLQKTCWQDVACESYSDTSADSSISKQDVGTICATASACVRARGLRGPWPTRTDAPGTGSGPSCTRTCCCRRTPPRASAPARGT